MPNKQKVIKEYSAEETDVINFINQAKAAIEMNNTSDPDLIKMARLYAPGNVAVTSAHATNGPYNVKMTNELETLAKKIVAIEEEKEKNEEDVTNTPPSTSEEVKNPWWAYPALFIGFIIALVLVLK